jgi:uncharacterized protein
VIPNFPDFKCLTWNNREEIEQFTRGFPLYSDFNFTSLYAWNIDGQLKVARLNGNLVVLFCDYLTEKPFLSFLGHNNASETACSLIGYSQRHFNEPSLKLVPECVTQLLCSKSFAISEDRDSFDYIYSTSDFCELPQWPAKYRASQQLRVFLKIYTDYAFKCFRAKEIDANILLELYAQWAFQRNINHIDTNEYRAFERLMNANCNSLCSLIIYVAGKPKGFVVFEILRDSFSINHFSKADISIKGVYEALNWHTAQFLSKLRIAYINFEQDLGIETLRQSKEKYKLHGFMKKFIVGKNL